MSAEIISKVKEPVRLGKQTDYSRPTLSPGIKEQNDKRIFLTQTRIHPKVFGRTKMTKPDILVFGSTSAGL